MKKLILVCGPAAIGKSTFCNNYAKEHPDEIVRVISADEVRKEMCGSYKNFPPNKNMKPIYEKIVEIAKELYNTMENVTVMLDTTMLYDGLRLYFIEQLPMFEDRRLYLLKLHDYGQCLIRNKKRIEEKWVPDEIIISMCKGYADPKPEVIEQFTEYKEFYVD
ncbi:MAG: ATP-binding protein [Bacilli bacterium]|nr:ATP-binding protein [Bacilli bacterium]